MATKKKSSKVASPRISKKPTPKRAAEVSVNSILSDLKKLATKKVLDGMARYGIPSQNAFGVAVGAMQKLAKEIGKNHKLAEALWKTGHYEARMLATFIEEIEHLTSEQMERWCQEFDSWAICDTACFKLFDQSPLAYKKATQWAKSSREFVKRAGFALMACLALHDKSATDDKLMPFLVLIEKWAKDDRNFVKKGVSWALRSIGERSAMLNSAAIELATRLSLSDDPACKWIANDVLRKLASPSTRTRLARKSK